MEQIVYHRHLPHYQPAEATFFVTYRLAGSLPMAVIRRLRQEFQQREAQARVQIRNPQAQQQELANLKKRYFDKFDTCLAQNLNEPYWLKQDPIAEIVAGSLQVLAPQYFELWAFWIMPNHVHILITLLPNAPILYRVLQQHKSFTATTGNQMLQRHGPFWEHESYDHVVRHNGEFERILAYILDNPVKARFVQQWQDWKWSYIHPKL